MNKPYLFIPATTKPAKAITLVVHGLNNHPDCMRSLADALSEMGSDVVLMRLSGHRNDIRAFANVTEQTWINDLLDAYSFARSLNGSDGRRPMYFLGYSLGALVNVSAISQHPDDVIYDKMVLLAPALTLKWHANLLKVLFGVGKKWLLPSLTPASYQANHRTPVQAYRVLFLLRKLINQSGYRHLQIPTKVFIDPRDELISVQGLQKLKTKYELTTWEIQLLRSKSMRRRSYYHLILDEQCVGTETWQQLKKEIRHFFNL